MAQAETEIMTWALIKLGAEPILSPNDNSNRARLVKLRYPIIRDQELAGHPWNFAISYVSLAAVTPKPSDVYDHDYVFQIPDDILHVLSTNLGDSESWEEIEGKRIAADVSEIIVKGIKRITDVSKFSPSFVTTLEWALAKDIAYSITQSTAQVDMADKGYKNQVKTARFNDARTGSVRQVVSDEWLNSRRY